jgi:hypothetical protein
MRYVRGELRSPQTPSNIGDIIIYLGDEGAAARGLWGTAVPHSMVIKNLE